MRRVVAFVCFLAISVVAGCAGEDDDSSRRAEQRPVDCTAYGRLVDLGAEPRYPVDYLHRWTTREGCPVRLDVIMTRHGPGACDGDRVAEIVMGRPLGRSHDRRAPARIFIRDPAGEIAGEETSTAFDEDADLPADAVDTGYRQGGRALWMRPGDDSFVYLVTAGRVEAWPRASNPAGCA